MDIAITGHTSGIGLGLYQYFAGKNHRVLGFSRHNGFDITSEVTREEIVTLSSDCAIFINNSYNNFDRSQYLLLEKIYKKWEDNREKLIINVSSRWTTDEHPYCENKREQDIFCERRKNNFPKIINLKPGWVDTPRVKSVNNKKISVSDVVDVVDFILSNRHKYIISNITFGL